jgi:hypothetical protein
VQVLAVFAVFKSQNSDSCLQEMWSCVYCIHKCKYIMLFECHVFGLSYVAAVIDAISLQIIDIICFSD